MRNEGVGVADGLIRGSQGLTERKRGAVSTAEYELVRIMSSRAVEDACPYKAPSLRKWDLRVKKRGKCINQQKWLPLSKRGSQNGQKVHSK